MRSMSRVMNTQSRAQDELIAREGTTTTSTWCADCHLHKTHSAQQHQLFISSWFRQNWHSSHCVNQKQTHSRTWLDIWTSHWSSHRETSWQFFVLEIAIPSPDDPRRTSYVLISRGKSRFVEESHIPNVRHTLTCAEVLSEQENAKESDPCLAQSKTGIQETGLRPLLQTHYGTRKLDADSITVSSSPVHLNTKRTIHMTERKWKIPANLPYGGRISSNSDLQNGHKIGASLWLRRTTDNLTQQFIAKLLKAFANKGARDFSQKDWLRHIHEGSSKTCIDGAHFWNFVRLERVCTSQGLMKKHPVITLQFPRKCTITAIGNVIRMPFSG